MALEVGSFETSPPFVPPTSAPTISPSLSSAAPTDGVFVSPPEVGNVSVQSAPESGGMDSTTTIALCALAAFLGILVLSLLVFLFVCRKRSRSREKSNTTLPITEDGNEGEQIEPVAKKAGKVEKAPLETLKGSPKRKKKRKKIPTVPSPSRLTAIEESLDDYLDEETDDEGYDLEANAEEENEEDLVDYLYDEQVSSPEDETPETLESQRHQQRTTVSKAVPLTTSSTDTDDIPDVSSENEGALVLVDTGKPRPYYMLDTRFGTAGGIVDVGNHQAHSSENYLQEEQIDTAQIPARNAIPPINLARSDGTTSPVYVEDGKNGGGHGAIVPVYHEQGRSVYAMDSMANNDIPAIQFTHTRSEATATSVYIEDDKQVDTNDAVVPVNHEHGRSVYAVDSMAAKNDIPPIQIKHKASDANASTSGTEHIVGPAALIALKNDTGRSPYAIESAATDTSSMMQLRRVFSDETSMSLYIEDDNTVPDKEAEVPANQERTQTSNAVSDGNASFAAKHKEGRSIDAMVAAAKNATSSRKSVDKRAYGTTSPAVFECQVSPSSSVYINDDGSVEMTVDAFDAPLDEKSPLVGSRLDSVKLDACASPVREDIDVEPIYQKEPKSVVRGSNAGTNRKAPRLPKKENSSRNRVSLSLHNGMQRPAEIGASVQLFSRTDAPPQLAESDTVSSAESSERTKKVTNKDVEISARDMRRMRLARSQGDRAAQEYTDSTLHSSRATRKPNHVKQTRSVKAPQDSPHYSDRNVPTVKDFRNKKISSMKQEQARTTTSTVDANAAKKEQSGGVFSSYLSGILKQVEEAENQFFNPPAVQKKSKSKGPVVQRVAPETQRSAPVVQRPAPVTRHTTPVIQRAAPVVHSDPSIEEYPSIDDSDDESMAPPPPPPLPSPGYM